MATVLQAFKQKWVYKDSQLTRTPIRRLFLQPPARPAAQPVAPLKAAFSARSGPSWQQITALAVMIFAVGMAAWLAPKTLAACLYWLCWGVFMGNAVMRLAACCIPVRPAIGAGPAASNENLPFYTVIVALYKEAEIVPQLLDAMLRLTYPRDRIEILFALEVDDRATIDAFYAQNLPPEVRIIEVPDGFPRTKPRALNHALGLATGDLVVIYDAEDQPHPDQLVAAARAFQAGDKRLACLQAPLRPVGASTFIGRQFAAEYAVQFDVLLPALNRLGLPFPLGGTSNHFRAEVLKTIGAWDAYNVTEDADLGLRLAQFGYTSGLIAPPTCETPPASSRVWLPQRTRWIKGYLQTLLVHTRLNTRFYPRVWTGLFLGVGLSAGAALAYAPFSGLVVVSMLMAVLQAIGNAHKAMPAMPLQDLALFAIGSLSAMTTLAVGVRRAGAPFALTDMLSAPFYWCLQSVAAGFALYKLVFEPFYWDKTEHVPVAHKPLAGKSASAYAGNYDHRRLPENPAHDGLG